MRTIKFEIDFYDTNGDLLAADQIESTPAEFTISAIAESIENVREFARNKTAEIGGDYAIAEWETISGKKRVFIIE